MKHIKPLFGTLVTLALVVRVQAQEPPTNGLAAYYPLDGNANDASGNGYTGTPTAITYGFDRFCQPSKAAIFNGLSSAIPVYGLENGNFFPVTLSVWVNGLPTPVVDYGVICKYAISSANGYALFAYGDHVRSWYFGSQGSVYGSSEGLQGLNTLDGKWHQVVVTYDFNGGVIYVDGVAVGSLAWSGNPSAATSPEPVIIGDYASSDRTDNRFFTGSLDDVRIYNRALSSSEVAQLYAIEAAPSSPHAGTGTATLVNGFVVSVSITDGGYGYTNTPLVRFIGGGGSGAQAVAVISNGVVTAINVLDAGFGYTNAPLLVIEPPFIPNPVLSIAPMSFLAFSNLTLGGVYQLQRSVAWYWSNQPVSFTATNALYTQVIAGVASSGDYRLALNPVPAQAFATPQVVNGFVVGATVTSGGSGYVTSPAITIIGGGGTNASAVANTSGGVVTNITITSAGIGYTNTPTIRIAPPPAAAVSPTVLRVMRVDSASLAPYDNYQIQFKPDIGGAWENWNGGLFSPTDVTNSQFLFITNVAGFFRLQYVP